MPPLNIEEDFDLKDVAASSDVAVGKPFTRGEYLCKLTEIVGEATPTEADFGLVSFRFVVIKGRHKGPAVRYQA